MQPPKTSFIQKLTRRFSRGKALNALYAALSLVIFSAIAGTAYFTLVFLLGAFNSVIFADTKDAKPEVSSFDLVSLEMLAPRFGIVVPDNGLSAKTAIISPPASLPAQEPVPSSSPPAPVVPEFNRAAFSISILNGTSKNGLAGEWKKRFLAEGFSNTTAANAKQKDIVGTELKYRASSAPALSALREIFQKNQTSLARETEDNTLSTDAEIIIGK